MKVPASHANKYGYATEGEVVCVEQGRCLVRLDITLEERWCPAALVRRWVKPDVSLLGARLARL